MILAARLLGLFMIYPVFVSYASHLRGATPAIIGIALGAYGFVHCVLQIPYGVVSDRMGRKPVIAVACCCLLREASSRRLVGPVVTGGLSSSCHLLVDRTPSRSGHRHYLRRTARTSAGQASPLIGALFWLGITATMRRPSSDSSYLARIGGRSPYRIVELTSRLENAPPLSMLSSSWIKTLFI